MTKRLIGRFHGVRIYEVDGKAVRRRHVRFVQGGHGRVYRFVPKNEIWVERMRDGIDQSYIAMHELVEYFLMRDRNWPYDKAHDFANEVEQKLRRRRATDSRLRGRRRT